MAISCTLGNDILKSTNCGYQLSEITDLYLANYADVTSTSISAGTDGADVVTAITMATGTTWFHIEPNKNSASFSDTLVVADNGVKYRTNELTFTVGGQYTAAQHANLDALSLGRYIAVVKLATGAYVMLGRLVPLEASAATFEGGNDNNGMTFTLTANVAESVMTLSDAAVATVVGS